MSYNYVLRISFFQFHFSSNKTQSGSNVFRVRGALTFNDSICNHLHFYFLKPGDYRDGSHQHLWSWVFRGRRSYLLISPTFSQSCPHRTAIVYQTQCNVQLYQKLLQDVQTPWRKTLRSSFLNSWVLNPFKNEETYM